MTYLNNIKSKFLNYMGFFHSIKSLNLFNIGSLSFYIGLFLIPSAFSLSAILLLISLLIGFRINKEGFFKDHLNIFLFLGFILMLISSFYNSNLPLSIENSEISYIFYKNVSLFNWFPIIFGFHAFKPYLSSRSLRKKSQICLLMGTFPVICSVIGQAFFELHGPMSTLGGLIVWYQRPIDGITDVTGLFNNQNYLGSWLCIVWPFCLALFLTQEKSVIKRLLVFLFLISIAITIVLTASRAALLSLLLSIPILLGKRSIKFLNVAILTFGITILFILFILFPIFGESFQNQIINFIPEGLWTSYVPSTYIGNISRVEIWKNALDIISKNPIFGIGGGSFPNLLEVKTGFWRGHTHNLPLELMVSYGIPAAIFILLPITKLIASSYKAVFVANYLFFKENLFDRAWITSLILLVLSHLVDIQYFDGRVSVSGWIILAGTSQIINKPYLLKNK